MDTTTSNNHTTTRRKSELDKFRLFYEYATPHKEIKHNLKQRIVRRPRADV